MASRIALEFRPVLVAAIGLLLLREQVLLLSPASLVHAPSPVRQERDAHGTSPMARNQSEFADCDLEAMRFALDDSSLFNASTSRCSVCGDCSCASVLESISFSFR